MRNLRSVAFAFLELLAFNAQKFTGSRDLTTPPFQNFFMVMLGLSLVACNPSVMFASFTILELLAFNAQHFWVHVSHAPFYPVLTFFGLAAGTTRPTNYGSL